MPNIQLNNQPVTQITFIEAEAGKQADAFAKMNRRARFMAQQPGFISISLHRSLDGRRMRRGGETKANGVKQAGCFA